MQEQEQACALRALTLCDGQVAAGLPPRMVDTLCYCRQLRRLTRPEQDLERTQVRINRARVMGAADEIDRIRAWRQSRW